jgi:hypothetical protein
VSSATRRTADGLITMPCSVCRPSEKPLNRVPPGTASHPDHIRDCLALYQIPSRDSFSPPQPGATYTENLTLALR